MQFTSPDPQQQISRALRRGRYRRALELAARAHGQELGRLCYALTGDQAEAEELTQEIFIAAFKAMPSFRGESSVRTWLYTIARRTCSRAVQKRQRRARLLSAVELPLPGGDDPHGRVEARHLGQQVRGALTQLSAGQQEVLLLRFASGLSYREVAAACGIAPEAARQRACSGLARLRQLLRPQAPAMRRGPGRVVAACQEVSS